MENLAQRDQLVTVIFAHLIRLNTEHLVWTMNKHAVPDGNVTNSTIFMPAVRQAPNPTAPKLMKSCTLVETDLTIIS